MLDSQNPELEAAGSRQSWHDLYKSSSWIYVGGLDYGLTEGDIEAVFSQYGKIVQLNYVKDRSVLDIERVLFSLFTFIIKLSCFIIKVSCKIYFNPLCVDTFCTSFPVTELAYEERCLEDLA